MNFWNSEESFFQVRKSFTERSMFLLSLRKCGKFEKNMPHNLGFNSFKANFFFRTVHKNLATTQWLRIDKTITADQNYLTLPPPGIDVEISRNVQPQMTTFFLTVPISPPTSGHGSYLIGNHIQISHGLENKLNITPPPTSGPGSYFIGNLLHISNGLENNLNMTQKIPPRLLDLGQI